MAEENVKVNPAHAPLSIRRVGTDNPKAEKRMDIIQAKVEQGRRYFGSSGASLTHQVSNPIYKDCGINPALAQAGIEGEHKTTKLLKEWIKTMPNAVLIDSVHIKGAGKEEVDEETGTMNAGDTDHVVIIGKMVLEHQ